MVNLIDLMVFEPPRQNQGNTKLNNLLFYITNIFLLTKVFSFIGFMTDYEPFRETENIDTKQF